MPLKDDGAPNVAGEYIYLSTRSQEPITIRFTIEGTSSICRQGSLWVNIPDRGAEFQRNSFREFKYGHTLSPKIYSLELPTNLFL